MKIIDIIQEAKDSNTVPKPRNFVAKHQKTSGSGAHKDKKKAEKQGDFKHKKKALPVDESATAGATSSANIGTVVSPHIAIGKDRSKKSYTGSPGKSGTKAPDVPKAVQKKNPDGTAKNALDMPNNIFGGGAVKR